MLLLKERLKIARYNDKIRYENHSNIILFYAPLKFRKAGRVWCGGARDALSHVSQRGDS